MNWTYRREKPMTVEAEGNGYAEDGYGVDMD